MLWSKNVENHRDCRENVSEQTSWTNLQISRKSFQNGKCQCFKQWVGPRPQEKEARAPTYEQTNNWKDLKKIGLSCGEDKLSDKIVALGVLS